LDRQRREEWDEQREANISLQSFSSQTTGIPNPSGSKKQEV